MKNRFSLKEDGFFLKVNSWFLPEYICKQVLTYGFLNMFAQSEVADNNKNIIHTSRTTEVCYLPKNNLTHLIQNKIQAFTGVNKNRYEPLQLLKYNPGGEYKAHFDAFPEGSIELQKSCGNREFTMIMYLNDLTSSGETVFPNIKIGVKPTCGTSVFFNNTKKGKINELSLHCGNPVKIGQKFILTQWIRENSVAGIW